VGDLFSKTKIPGEGRGEELRALDKSKGSFKILFILSGAFSFCGQNADVERAMKKI
jgi:hypothetical protein